MNKCAQVGFSISQSICKIQALLPSSMNAHFMLASFPLPPGESRVRECITSCSILTRAPGNLGQPLSQRDYTSLQMQKMVNTNLPSGFQMLTSPCVIIHCMQFSLQTKICGMNPRVTTFLAQSV